MCNNKPPRELHVQLEVERNIRKDQAIGQFKKDFAGKSMSLLEGKQGQLHIMIGENNSRSLSRCDEYCLCENYGDSPTVKTESISRSSFQNDNWCKDV